MPELTVQRLNEIIDVLEESSLTRAAYDVSTDEPSGVLVKITTKDYAQFSVTLQRIADYKSPLAQAAFGSTQFDPSKDFHLVSIESPGDYLENQSTAFTEFSEFLKRLRLWCDRVKVTLERDDSRQRQLSELRERFEKEFVSHVGDANAHFTREEKKSLFAQIDELGIELQGMISNDAAKAKKIEQLESMIAEMKQATALPKKAAYRVITSKLAGFMVTATGSALIAEGVDHAIKLLTGSQ